MLQAAASWLITVLPLVDFDCEPNEITRVGNEHRKFIPTNVYTAKIGSWRGVRGSGVVSASGAMRAARGPSSARRTGLNS